ncbi:MULTISPECIES: DivIVA domain-containing protein [Corynebacterium]|uniref:DivIVA domain-containing protein n=1 Tax=Corynebacterium tuberculostearicum TaxID=38304 RepID=A0AAE4NJQ4_9CORY|nr:MULTISPECIES: DivIVA domain-containing protein [Corynebacterium]MCT1427543.1 DivIVA domain-containing protein [Corynebacterium sp. p3-SID1241]MDV2418473.1 DivIVA domain-containing protein [Corynebacterium tuberculostearicum]WKE58214.1 DivIVA domain-containing protein [Corynebacterium tuberculostearicum]
MLSWIMLLVVLFALVIIGTWAWGSIFGRAEVMHPLDESEDVRKNNRAAVREGCLDKVKFEVVPRGYRQDQVDDLLAQLEEQLSSAQKRSKLERKEIN